jgi:hypothetical protein
MDDIVIINGVEYVAFSIYKAAEGGISQKSAIELLKENGIKARTGCHSQFVGQYGLWVEAAHSAAAEKLLFG